MGRGKGGEASAIPFMVPHLLVLVFGLLALICSCVAYSAADGQQAHVFRGFFIALSLLASLYGLSAFIEDFKRTDYAWKRAHMNFLYVDLILLVLILPVAIAGAVRWESGDTDKSQAFNGAVACLWVTWFGLVVVTIQDNVSVQYEESLL